MVIFSAWADTQDGRLSADVFPFRPLLRSIQDKLERRPIMRAIVFLVLVLAVASPVYAASDAAQPVKDSAAVQNAVDDRPALLEGRLMRQMGEDMFLFVDDSGDVIVEIDDDILRGGNVSPGSRVRLNGHVEKDDGSSYVEVDTLELME
jgi:uncharacterized protein (TIGR00156 family)